MNDKELALKIIELTGSKENISSVRHCATRLRLVVKNKDKINVKAIESLDKVKGSFFNSGQYQIILGTGLVNRVYDEVIKVTGEEGNNNHEKIVYEINSKELLEHSLMSLYQLFLYLLQQVYSWV